MRPPKIIKPYVKSFARNVVRTTGSVELNYVECRSLKNLPEDECFPIVEEHSKKNGGKGITGWAIWERPKVFIEAEFHMVWETPEKNLVDVVPRSIPINRILFLRDPHRRYKGRQIDNIRKALTNDPDVNQLFRLFKRKFEIMNEGELAEDHGLVAVRPEYAEVERDVEMLCYKLNQRYGPWTPEA